MSLKKGGGTEEDIEAMRFKRSTFDLNKTRVKTVTVSHSTQHHSEIPEKNKQK